MTGTSKLPSAPHQCMKVVYINQKIIAPQHVFKLKIQTLSHMSQVLLKLRFTVMERPADY